MALLTNQSNLTQSQFLLWMGQQINPDFPVYNMAHAYRIMGEIDPQALDQAFQKVVASSDALRSVVRIVDGVPKRQENPAIQGLVELFDFSDASNPNQSYQQWVDERITRILDLENQLFDTALIKLAQDRWIWYLNQHHVITDAIATGLVYQATAEFYELAVAGKLDESPALPQFSTFVDAEKDHKQSDRYKNAAAYWAEKIGGEPTELNFYGKKVPEKAGTAKRVALPLGAARSAKLKEIAMEDGFASLSMDMSLSTLFGSVLATTIHRITGEKQIRIGTPFHGRQSAAFKKTIGVFIEIGMMQIDIEAGDTFATIGEKVLDETFTNMMQIQPGISTPEVNQSFNVILNYINGTSGDFGGHQVSTDWIHSGYCDANQAFRLQITDFDQTGELTCLFDLATAVFGPAESRWLTEQFLVVIDQLIADHEQPIGGFSLLTSDQHQSHFVEFNQTDTPYPSDKTVVDLFAEQVAKHPNAIAAQRGDTTLTYAQLDQQSNQLANQLIELGAVPETTVAICMQRSLEVLVAIWGVLKSGAAYVPIDPSYPAERRNMMLADAEPLAVLVNSSEIAELVETNQPIIIIDATAPLEPSLSAIPASLSPISLAYMIYTSGSTGTPKGTMLTHQGLTNYAVWAQKVYQNGDVFDFPLYSSL
ncbi:MAG: condensation domain-containing protein, partial [Anaerolineae bacterium]